MTLIISSLRPKDLLITSDGRCSITRNGVATFDDKFQKIFPIPDHPVAIFNHGENQFENRPLGQFLGDFIKSLNTGNLTIEEIADELRHYAHPHVRSRLKHEGGTVHACGFCVGGFATHPAEPRMVELFWKLTGDNLLTEEHQWSPITITTSGIGAKQITPADVKQIEGKSLDEVERYHQTLMDQAMHAKVDPNTVGGHVHELLITRYGCKWTKPPAPADH